jgi:Mn-dependent DtxR family transcriptional regulator
MLQYWQHTFCRLESTSDFTLQEANMGRQTNRERLQQINDFVQQHPGIRPAEIARELDLPRSSVTRTLPALEDEGYLLSEDRHGRLWPCRK